MDNPRPKYLTNTVPYPFFTKLDQWQNEQVEVVGMAEEQAYGHVKGFIQKLGYKIMPKNSMIKIEHLALRTQLEGRVRDVLVTASTVRPTGSDHNYSG